MSRTSETTLTEFIFFFSLTVKNFKINVHQLPRENILLLETKNLPVTMVCVCMLFFFYIIVFFIFLYSLFLHVLYRLFQHMPSYKFTSYTYWCDFTSVIVNLFCIFDFDQAWPALM